MIDVGEFDLRRAMEIFVEKWPSQVSTTEGGHNNLDF